MRAERFLPGIARILFAGFCFTLASCGDVDRNSGGESVSESTIPIVVTSNYPLHFFATRIASGIDTTLDIILPKIDGDPASWIPDTAQIQTLQSADLIIVNGAGAEPWLNWITLDQGSIIDTSSKMPSRLIGLDASALHQHGPKGDHSHRAMAFTTWLDPQLAIEQARAVEHALAALTPAHAAQFSNNLSVLEQDLSELDGKLSEVFEQLQGRPVFFSHPVYQYLQRRYGINGQSLHWEPGEEPSTPDWIDLQQRLASHPAKIIIWEDEPLPSTTQRLSKAGITSVAYHTAANRPAQGDFVTIMLRNAQRWRKKWQFLETQPAK